MSNINLGSDLTIHQDPLSNTTEFTLDSTTNLLLTPIVLDAFADTCSELGFNIIPISGTQYRLYTLMEQSISAPERFNSIYEIVRLINPTISASGLNGVDISATSNIGVTGTPLNAPKF
jgi:hypothetical protein